MGRERQIDTIVISKKIKLLDPHSKQATLIIRFKALQGRMRNPS